MYLHEAITREFKLEFNPHWVIRKKKIKTEKTCHGFLSITNYELCFQEISLPTTLTTHFQLRERIDTRTDREYN